MKAATKGHKDVVRVLLEHGADVNISSTEVKPLLPMLAGKSWLNL